MTSKEIAEKYKGSFDFVNRDDREEQAVRLAADIDAALAEARREQALADCRAVEESPCGPYASKETIAEWRATLVLIADYIRAAYVAAHGKPLEETPSAPINTRDCEPLNEKAGKALGEIVNGVSALAARDKVIEKAVRAVNLLLDSHLGPLDFAAKYGDGMDPNDFDQNAFDAARELLTLVESTKGVK